MNDAASPDKIDPTQLQHRIDELEREREHLLAVVEILQDITGSLHFVDILQTITRKLGDLYGLDRCSIFLGERRGTTARLVASYEDPALRNHVVDLDAYPELKRALRSGETVFIPDAAADPNLRHIHAALSKRGAKAITVVPIAWRQSVIGAIFLRTYREGPSFSETDIAFCKMIGSLTARALRNAHRFERLQHQKSETGERVRQAHAERVAIVGFLRRLMDSFGARDESWTDDLLSDSAARELDRLTEVAMTVIEEEGKAR